MRKWLRIQPSSKHVSKYRIDATGNCTTESSYSYGELMERTIIDEDEYSTTEIIDDDGNILELNKNSLQVLYIYDDYGRLRYILQPILRPSDFDAQAEELNHYAFCYNYDHAGRVTSKKEPGKVAENFKYSKAGRLIAESNGNLDTDKWRIYLYDRLGRNVLTAIASPSDADFDKIAKNACTLDYDPDSPTRYSIKTLELDCDLDIEKIYFFDSYRFTQTLDYVHPAAIEGFNRTPMSLATGALKVEDGEVTQFEIYLYDSMGRRKGICRHLPHCNTAKEYEYGRAGDVTKETTTFYLDYHVDKVLTTEYEYDSNQRPVKVKSTLGLFSSIIKTVYNNQGKVDSICYGTKISKRFQYDLAGHQTKGTILREWSERVPIQFPELPGIEFQSEVGGITPPNPGGGIDLTKLIIHHDYYNEFIDYTDNHRPRFNGTPSSYQNTFGGRYDYEFDQCDRLMAANYSNQNATHENFSTEYTYDKLCRAIAIKRYGVVDIDGDTEEFGILDDVTLNYDGAHFSSYTTGDRDGFDFFPRTGVDLSDRPSIQTYTRGGNRIYHNFANLEMIIYDNNGLPQRISRRPKVLSMNGSIPQPYLRYTYDLSGNKLSETWYDDTNPAAGTRHRTYADGFRYGGRTIDGITTDTLEQVEFPGGYFDSKGIPHYRIHDYFGNVAMIVNNSGTIEQHNGYYPYGQLWRDVTNPDRLFQSKTRPPFIINDLYDFSVRLYDSALLQWYSPDRLACETPWAYAYCLGNPIRFADPSGLIPTKRQAALMASAAYGDDNDAIDKLENFKWFVIDNHQTIYDIPDKNGLNTLLFGKQSNNANGEYSEFAYAYAGTDFMSLSDVIADVAQLIGISSQYNTAIDNAIKLSEKLGDLELTFVGHSLGGGEAAAASMATGRAAMTFNPAALSNYTIQNQHLNNNKNNITNYRIIPSNVFSIGNFNYGIGGCFISNLQDKFDLIPPGVTIKVQIPYHNIFEVLNPLYGHSIERFIE